MTRQVFAGRVAIGGGAPVSVQTMTNTDTRDVEATLNQIRAMAEAGADIVRVSVYDEACAEAVRALVDGSPVPLVADIPEIRHAPRCGKGRIFWKVRFFAGILTNRGEIVKALSSRQWSRSVAG